MRMIMWRIGYFVEKHSKETWDTCLLEVTTVLCTPECVKSPPCLQLPRPDPRWWVLEYIYTPQTAAVLPLVSLPNQLGASHTLQPSREFMTWVKTHVGSYVVCQAGWNKESLSDAPPTGWLGRGREWGAWVAPLSGRLDEQSHLASHFLFLWAKRSPTAILFISNLLHNL